MDPVATTFDTFAGALAGAAAVLGTPFSPEEALIATGRAFRARADARLRPLLPETDRAVHEDALAPMGLTGEVLSAQGPDVAPAVLRVVEAVRAGAPALLYGAGGPVFGLVTGSSEEALVARTALASKPLELPIQRLAGAARLYSVLVTGTREREPLALAAIARDELAAPPPSAPPRGPAAYEAIARALAAHPLSRLEPEGLAWKVAELAQARRAACIAYGDAELAREEALLAEARALFPLPDAGLLSSERLERGAALFREAKHLLETWLERAALR